jgi:hypothetical protein
VALTDMAPVLATSVRGSTVGTLIRHLAYRQRGSEVPQPVLTYAVAPAHGPQRLGDGSPHRAECSVGQLEARAGEGLALAPPYRKVRD